jgi:C_GCAxxG_C_C family probable redox protein
VESNHSPEVERAVALFADGYSCSQAVLMAFASRLEIDETAAARVAAAFGGGISRLGWTCGAVSGACMAVGLHAGRGAPDNARLKEDAAALGRLLVQRFRAEHGSTACRDLIRYDLSDPAQHEAARAAGVFADTCPAFVRTAAAFVAETLSA